MFRTNKSAGRRAKQLRQRLGELGQPLQPKPLDEQEASEADPRGAAGVGTLPKVPVLGRFSETLAEATREIRQLAEVRLKEMSRVEPLVVSHLVGSEGDGGPTQEGSRGPQLTSRTAHEAASAEATPGAALDPPPVRGTTEEAPQLT